MRYTGFLDLNRDNEFKNSEIDKILKENNIKKSLSKKGCPFDNAILEATYKIIKTGFAYNTFPYTSLPKRFIFFNPFTLYVFCQLKRPTLCSHSPP